MPVTDFPSVLQIKDSIHGYIQLSKVERDIIDLKISQRLRYIRGPAGLSLVYPGADISLMVTSTADTTYSFFPVWVAPIGRNAGNPTRQTQKSISNTARDVNAQSKI